MQRIRLIELFVFVVMGACSSPLLGQWLPTYINGSFTLGQRNGSSPYSLADTFFLESNPTATKTIYLDFDGHHSVNNQWGHNIVFDAFDRDGNVNSFSNSELIEIQRQFQNVAEDFLPFDVNVTTRDPGLAALVRSNSGDNRYGIRALNTQYKNGFGEGTGGIAYLDSFSRIGDDTPVFTFNKGENNGGMTNSHEVGHALGLRHDGLNGSTYHPGTGSGSTSWGPIMGAPFGKNLTQWSNGDYPGSTRTEDDLSIITKSANGFGFRADDHGNTWQLATEVTIDNNLIFDWGIIERNTDLDFFAFDLAAGDLSLMIQPFEGRPNLDVLARFYDTNGVELFSSNPLDEVFAAIDFQILEAGRYFLSIEGTGKAGVYSDYGSLGFYSIEGSFMAVPEPSTVLPMMTASLIWCAYRRRRRG